MAKDLNTPGDAQDTEHTLLLCGADDTSQLGYSYLALLQVKGWTSVSRVRITEWFGLEWTLKTIQFQPPLLWAGHLPQDQFIQTPIRPGFEHFQ